MNRPCLDRLMHASSLTLTLILVLGPSSDPLAATTDMADLTVTVAFDDPTPLVGDTVGMAVRLTNDGPAAATSIVVDLPVPPGTEHSGHVASVGTWDTDTGRWTVPRLDPGQAATVDAMLRVAPAAGDPDGSGEPVDGGIFASDDGLGLVFGMAFLPDGRLWVSSDEFFDQLQLFDRDGTLLEAITIGQIGPRRLLVGPDGLLYLSCAEADEVRRYDPETGALVDVFVAAGVGGIDGPIGLAFTSNGDLLVGNFRTDQVLRYRPDGSFAGVAVDAGTGGLADPRDLAIGPDGTLFVASLARLDVLRFDLEDGSFLGSALPPGHGLRPSNITFGAANTLFVTDNGGDGVVRFEVPGAGVAEDGPLGLFAATGGGLVFPGTQVFGPGGDLFVANESGGTIHRFRGYLTASARVLTRDQVDPRPGNDGASNALDWRRLDFGDAASPFPTLLVDDGARHEVPSGGAWLYLGAMPPDTEPDGQPVAGDGADEDGVSWSSLGQGQSGHAEVTVTGDGGRLDAWIDFDDDGMWSAGEQVAADLPVPEGTTMVPFAVPLDAAAGPVDARFRISRRGGLGVVGQAFDGEVEDHRTPVIAGGADLSLLGQPVPDPVMPGSEVALRLEVANGGASRATGVVVTVDLPPESELVATAGCQEDPNGVPACTLGDLDPASSASVELTVQIVYDIDEGIDAEGAENVVEHGFSVAADTFDPEPADNTAIIAVTVDGTPPIVTGAGGLPWIGPDLAGGCTTLTSAIPTGFGLTVSEDLAGINDPAAWRLVYAGTDRVLGATDCSQTAGDDEARQPIAIVWDPASQRAELDFDGSFADGRYRLLACADRLADRAGNPLDGDDDGNGGDDFAVDLRIDRGNLLANGHLDCWLDPWTVATPRGAGTTVVHATEDTNDDPTSGSAVFDSASGDTIVALGQCVAVPAARVLGWSVDVRVDEVAAGSLAIGAGCSFWTGNSCNGADLGFEGFRVSAVPDPAIWRRHTGRLPSPPGSASALCAIDLGAAEGPFRAFVDRLRYGSLIFTDGFESGDLSRWSAIEPP